MSAIRIEPPKKKNIGSVYVTLDDEIINSDYSDFEDLGDLSGGIENEVIPEREVWVEGTSEKPTEGRKDTTEGKVLVSQNVKFSGVPKNRSKEIPATFGRNGSADMPPPMCGPRGQTIQKVRDNFHDKVTNERTMSLTRPHERNQGIDTTWKWRRHSDISNENKSFLVGVDSMKYCQPGPQRKFIDSWNSTTKPEVLRIRQDRWKFRESEMSDKSGERRKVDIPLIGGKSDEVKGKIERKRSPTVRGPTELQFTISPTTTTTHITVTVLETRRLGRRLGRTRWMSRGNLGALVLMDRVSSAIDVAKE
ncbi:hypothetical protein TREMEDRAFT_65126 [Tremella mesenterica DSM 1558]|uniref:uncharacterized protein n=1 Tax=Tremella mesenterica (strain ATCC 24925 / CBS 8224 / DSM 1558 / NBRC 9311 / NRRL Y-6157 / RJB 2259-6 / UBC 559-6) TaxID=578456 RepID=UPI00032B93F7|nr:uncharacterized protein TREMEDRAFT_65126 [Tremella mesenterica DSM 1558]EIW66731.1 hypothetical protein TREMEDRAFT_65126 [Tremella mesenterica DSM 1558]